MLSSSRARSFTPSKYRRAFRFPIALRRAQAGLKDYTAIRGTVGTAGSIRCLSRWAPLMEDADILQQAVERLLNDDHDGARSVLRQLSIDDPVQRPAIESESSNEDRTAPSRPTFRTQDFARILQRDGWRCHYCSRKLVVAGVVALLGKNIARIGLKSALLRKRRGREALKSQVARKPPPKVRRQNEARLPCVRHLECVLNFPGHAGQEIPKVSPIVFFHNRQQPRDHGLRLPLSEGAVAAQGRRVHSRHDSDTVRSPNRPNCCDRRSRKAKARTGESGHPAGPTSCTDSACEARASTRPKPTNRSIRCQSILAPSKRYSIRVADRVKHRGLPSRFAGIWRVYFSAARSAPRSMKNCPNYGNDMTRRISSKTIKKPQICGCLLDCRSRPKNGPSHLQSGAFNHSTTYP
jgi:hypothetical protein